MMQNTYLHGYEIGSLDMEPGDTKVHVCVADLDSAEVKSNSGIFAKALISAGVVESASVKSRIFFNFTTPPNLFSYDD